MPNRFKVQFKENGERCPKNIQKLRRLPECGIFDRNLLPFTPINPAPTPDPPPKPPPIPPPPKPPPYQPIRFRGLAPVLNDGLIPDAPKSRTPIFPSEPGRLVGGATGPGNQYNDERLPQDETTQLALAKGLRVIRPSTGYRAIIRPTQDPFELTEDDLNQYRNEEHDRVDLDDLFGIRPADIELQNGNQLTTPARRPPTLVEDNGAGVGIVPKPRDAPSGDPRDFEFGPMPDLRDFEFGSPRRSYKRPIKRTNKGKEKALINPKKLNFADNGEAGGSGLTQSEMAATETIPNPLRQRSNQARRMGLRNVDVATPEQIELQGQDVRDTSMSSRKRQGDFFELEQGSPSRFRPRTSRGRTTSQLDSRASQLRRNISLASNSAKKFRTNMSKAIELSARDVVRDIRGFTTRQFGQGYERVVSDTREIRGMDIEMGYRGASIAALDDGSITLSTPITEDVTGLRDIALDFSPLDAVRDQPVIPGRSVPKLTFSERLATASQSFKKVTTTEVVGGAGAAGVGFLAGIGVAQLLGPQVHTGNKYADSSIVGGASGAFGDVVGRTAGLIGQKFLIRGAETAAADAAIFTGMRVGTALLRGGVEGLGIGLVAAPLELLLNDALVNDLHLSHGLSNVISSGAVGVGTTTAIGLVSLFAAPETMGISLIVGGIATAGSMIVGGTMGAVQDSKEKEAKEKQLKARQRVVDLANARSRFLQTLPNYQYDFYKALAAYKDKDLLGMDDESWGAFSHSAYTLFQAKPSNTPIPVGGGGDPPTEDQQRIDKLYSKYIKHTLIGHVCSGVTTGCEDLKANDPGSLSSEDMKFLNDKTGGTWLSQANMQVEMSEQELHYTQSRIKTAQEEIVNAWNKDQKLPSQLNAYTVETANLDSTFESRYRTAIKLDAQQRVIDAYKESQTKLEDMAPNIQTAAQYDKGFAQAMNAFYADMEDSATELEVTLPQLIQLQALSGEEQRSKYQEMQFDRVKTQQDVVDQAQDLATEQDTVRTAGFYDIDQAYLETDPTAITQWHPSDSQILQAHAAGMNLNQYVAYMHQLALGEAGDYTKLPTYTEEELRQSGMLDFSHLQDELKLAGYRPDLYIYDPVTRLFTLNPSAASTLPNMGEAKSFISAYTPEYLVKARQEYADMIHGLNEKNQADVDAYNTNLRREVSEYGAQYEEMVEAQNQYLLSHAGPVTYLLHYHANDVYNQYRIDYNPISDVLPGKGTVVDSNTVSAPNLPTKSDPLRIKQGLKDMGGAVNAATDKISQEIASLNSDPLKIKQGLKDMGSSVNTATDKISQEIASLSQKDITQMQQKNTVQAA